MVTSEGAWPPHWQQKKRLSGWEILPYLAPYVSSVARGGDLSTSPAATAALTP